MTQPQPVLLKDQAALVTGGGSGLGAALCEELARRGARVLVVDQKEDKALQTVQALADAGFHAEALAADVS